MRFPDGRKKALTFSYDDGVKQDGRLIEILNAHGMKGTFNINGNRFAPEEQADNPDYNCYSKQTALRIYTEPHEVALHSFTHPFLESLPSGMCSYEVVSDRLALENLFGKIVCGMAYPMGTYSDMVVDVLKACGVVYSRTTKATEKFDLPTDFLRWNPTCHHNHPRLMELADEFLNKNVRHYAQLFYLWGHSYEFRNNNNWNIIEDFTDKMAGKEDTIWYATNMEIFEYMTDYKRLVWSADGLIVNNPTTRTLWFERNHVLFSIKPGETMRVDHN